MPNDSEQVTLDEILDLSHFQNGPGRWALRGVFPDPTDEEAVAELFNVQSCTQAQLLAFNTLGATDKIVAGRFNALGVSMTTPWKDLPRTRLEGIVRLVEDVMDSQLFQMQHLVENMRSRYFGVTPPAWPEPFRKKDISELESDPIVLLQVTNASVEGKIFTQSNQSGTTPRSETRWALFHIVWSTAWLRAYAQSAGIRKSMLGVLEEMPSEQTQTADLKEAVRSDQNPLDESGIKSMHDSAGQPEKITRAEFDALSSVSFRHPMAAAMMEEIEWYKSSVTAIAGFVGRDKSDNDYWAMVFGPDPSGKLGWIAGDNDFKTEAEARARLFEVFAEQEKSGQNVFCHCTSEPCSCGCPDY